MRGLAVRFVCGLIALLAILGLSSGAMANKLDLALSRFVTGCQAGDPTACVAHRADYEKFMAQYTFGLSPKVMAPAETLGYSGFYMGLEGTLTPVPDADKQDLWAKGTIPANAYPDVMFMPAVHIRKGLPWSFEVGSTINYLAQSELVGLGGEIKWSLFEGYQHGFRGVLPDIAARGSVMRVLGESDVDLTIIGVDGSISYPFGIGGMVSFTPYGGFQYIWSIIRIEPLVTQIGDEYVSATGLSSPDLTRSRIFGGFRFNYEMLSITFEMAWGLKANWDTREQGRNVDVSVGHQLQFSGGAGIDF